MKSTGDIIEEYLQKGLAAVENANLSWGPNGLLAAVGGEALKQHYLGEMAAAGHAELVTMHTEGTVHIHDLSLGMYTPYCCGHSLPNLLANGFQSGFVCSGPSKRLRTAVGHICNYIGSASNEWAGAQAFSDIDVHLAPYLYKDFLDFQKKYRVSEEVARTMARDEAFQCMQELVYPLNVTTRYGAQSPFSNLSLALEIPGDMRNQPVLIAGKQFGDMFPDTHGGRTVVYADMEEWAQEIANALIMVYTHGDYRKIGFTFPILNLNVTEKFFSHPLKNKILALTAKFGTPSFSNYINGLTGGQAMDPADVRAMCCRLSVDTKAVHKHCGGAFGNADQTGSLQVVTMSFPAIAMESAASAGAEKHGKKGKKGQRTNTAPTSLDAFLARVGEIMDRIYAEQCWKRDVIETKFKENFYPTASGNFAHGLRYFYTTIGYVGLWEAVQVVLGDEHSFSTDRGLEAASIILQFCADRCREYSERGNGMVNFEATPAESAAHKLALKALKRFPDVPVQGNGYAPYFCNSCHLPPHMQGRLDVALESQDRLQPIHTGGTVYHYHTNEELKAADAETILRALCKTRIPQFTISPVYSVCPACGARFAGHVEECPNTHTAEQLERVRRMHPESIIVKRGE